MEDIELDALVLALIEEEFGRVPDQVPALPPVAKKPKQKVRREEPVAKKPKQESALRRDIDRAVRRNVQRQNIPTVVVVTATKTSKMTPGLTRKQPVVPKRRRELKPMDPVIEKRRLAEEKAEEKKEEAPRVKEKQRSSTAPPPFVPPLTVSAAAPKSRFVTAQRRPVIRPKAPSAGNLYLKFKAAEDSILNVPHVTGERGEMEFFQKAMLPFDQVQAVETEIAKNPEQARDLQQYFQWLKDLRAAHLNWVALQGRIIRNPRLNLQESEILLGAFRNYLAELDRLSQFDQKLEDLVRGPRDVLKLYLDTQLGFVRDHPLDRVKYVWEYLLDTRQDTPFYQLHSFNVDPLDLLRVIDQLDQAAVSITRLLPVFYPDFPMAEWQVKRRRLSNLKDEIEATLQESEESIDYSNVVLEPISKKQFPFFK